MLILETNPLGLPTPLGTNPFDSNRDPISNLDEQLKRLKQ